MSKKTFIHVIIMVLISIIPGLDLVPQAVAGGGGGFSAPPAKFGFVYGIEGKVDLKSSRSDPVRLKKEKDILRIVIEGDKLRTNEDGRLLILSLSGNIGFELMPDTLVRIVSNEISLIRGTVNKIEGLYGPESVPQQPEKNGILVTSKPMNESCIKPLSPLNTSIITVTPKLTWENSCKGDHRVTVKLISKKQIIYQAITGDTSMKVPKDLLDFGDICTWLIDGGEYGIVGGTFSIVSESEMKEAIEKKYQYTQHENDLHERVSYIFYLKSRGLNEMANSEIQLMKEDFPENPYIKVQ